MTVRWGKFEKPFDSHIVQDEFRTSASSKARRLCSAASNARSDSSCDGEFGVWALGFKVEGSGFEV